MCFWASVLAPEHKVSAPTGFTFGEGGGLTPLWSSLSSGRLSVPFIPPACENITRIENGQRLSAPRASGPPQRPVTRARRCRHGGDAVAWFEVLPYRMPGTSARVRWSPGPRWAVDRQTPKERFGDPRHPRAIGVRRSETHGRRNLSGRQYAARPRMCQKIWKDFPCLADRPRLVMSAQEIFGYKPADSAY